MVSQAFDPVEPTVIKLHPQLTMTSIVFLYSWDSEPFLSPLFYNIRPAACPMKLKQAYFASTTSQATPQMLRNHNVTECE